MLSYSMARLGLTRLVAFYLCWSPALTAVAPPPARVPLCPVLCSVYCPVCASSNVLCPVTAWRDIGVYEDN